MPFQGLLEASKRLAQHRDRKCQPFHPEEVIEVGVFDAKISGVGVGYIIAPVHPEN